MPNEFWIHCSNTIWNCSLEFTSLCPTRTINWSSSEQSQFNFLDALVKQHPASRAPCKQSLLLSFSLLRRRKGGSARITSTLWSLRSPSVWTSQSCSNRFFQCERPFSDKTDGYNWARCTMKNQDGGEIWHMGSRLYPGNMQRIFNKDLTRFMQSLSRERQNRASKRKALLAGW